MRDGTVTSCRRIGCINTRGRADRREPLLPSFLKSEPHGWRSLDAILRIQQEPNDFHDGELPAACGQHRAAKFQASAHFLTSSPLSGRVGIS